MLGSRGRQQAPIRLYQVLSRGCGAIGAHCCTCRLRRVRRAQLVRVADDNGIRFPREFGLLLKQLLYFDRYTRLLAPKLSVLSDDRITRTGRPAGPLYP